MSSGGNVTCQLKNSEVGNAFLIIFLTIETLVGLPGSILALWIFCCRIKLWKSHITFLFNICLADFLLFLSVPFRIDTHLQKDNWKFGQVWCRINLYMLSVNRSASISFMTAVAIDRYLKVVHPHHPISRLSSSQARKVSALIWLVVSLYRLPLLMTNLLHEETEKKLCRSFHYYTDIPLAIKVHYAAYVLEFILPLFLLFFCSVRIACQIQKVKMERERAQRAIRAVMVINMVFILCFMPGVVTGLVGHYIKTFHPEECESYKLWINLFMVSIGFTYLNSALDPVIYFFSSSVFHDTLRNSLKCKRDIGEDSSL